MKKGPLTIKEPFIFNATLLQTRDITVKILHHRGVMVKILQAGGFAVQQISDLKLNLYSFAHKKTSVAMHTNGGQIE